MTTPASSLQHASRIPTEHRAVRLHLVDRIVEFLGSEVSIIPGQNDPFTGMSVFVTAKGNVALYDRTRRSLTVQTLDEFTSEFSGSPVGWIVDDVFDALPRPFEQLDI